MAIADTAELIVAMNLRGNAAAGLRNFNSQLSGMQAGMAQTGRGVGQLGAGIARVGTVAAVAAGGGLFAVTKWAIDAETAFAGVAKTVDETVTTSYADLADQLNKLASRKPQEFAELAQIGEFGGQLGVSADALGAFVDTVSDFLVAVPQMGLEEAAFGLQRIAVLTKVADEDFSRIGSTIVELGNNFATTESAIIGTAERFASQATAIGLSTEATLGLSAALTALGGEPQEAGTSMQRLFQRINLALAEGGAAAQLFADVSGQSAKQFRDSWEQDAEGTLLRFLAGMGDANLSAIEQTAILDDLGLADARLGKNVLNLANNMDVTTGALTSANEEWETNTAQTIEAQKRYDTLASKLKVLKNNITLAGVAIGNELTPVISELAGEFTEFLGKPETQANLREFAVGLGEDIRNLVTEVRKFDWDPIIGGLEMAGRVLKGALDIFKSLPAPLQGFIVGGLALNKLSGGLLGKGLGNIIGGALKTIHAANVTVIGGNVTGGAGGPAARAAGGAGALGLLGTVGIAGLALAALTTIATEVSKTANPTGFNFNQLAGQSGVTRVQVEGDLLTLSAETGRSVTNLQAEMIPLLRDGNLTWDQIVDAVGTGADRAVTAADRAEAAARDAIPWLQRNQQETHDLNASEGTRFASQQRIAQEALTADRNLVAQAQRQQSALDSLAGTAQSTTSAVQTGNAILAGKSFDPKITVQNFVSISATVLQQQLVSLRTTVGGGGFI